MVGKIKWRQFPAYWPGRPRSLLDNPPSHQCGWSAFNDLNWAWPFLGLTKKGEKKACRRALMCASLQRGKRREQNSWEGARPSTLQRRGIHCWTTSGGALNLPFLWTSGLTSGGNNKDVLAVVTVCTRHSEKPTSTCPADMGSGCLPADGSHYAGTVQLVSPLMSNVRPIVSLSFIWLYNKSGPWQKRSRGCRGVFTTLMWQRNNLAHSGSLWEWLNDFP